MIGTLYFTKGYSLVRRISAVLMFLGTFSFCSHQSCLGQNGSYQIQHIDLRIEPDFNRKAISLSATIEIRNPGLETEFTFGLNNRYDSVAVVAGSSATSIKRADDEITVTLTHPSENVRLVFALSGSLGKSIDENCEIVTDSSLFLLWSDRFYPIDFGRWAAMKTEVVLPSGFQVIAPGRITHVENIGSNVIWTFETSRPTISASVFANSRWIKTERELNGIRMRTLLSQESQKFSDEIFRTSSEIVKFFSETLCPYPFDEFTFVTIRGMYARRAFPGFVGYKPRYLEKEFTTTGHDAHETSLLWWTYTLHGTGPGSFQWTEGFGDYAEILYDEVYHKPVPKIFQRFRGEYLATPADQDLLYSDLRGNTPQKFIHGKYPWLMHVVRSVVGDSAFRSALKLVFKRFQYRTFSMSEFISTLEEGCGQSLRWWREEWLGRKGVPTIAMSSQIQKRDSHYVVVCTLEQRGNTYHLPISVGIESRLGLRVEKVLLNEKRMTFTMDSIEEPTRITLDPQGWVLMNVTSLE
jgi:hypothetical protein